MKGNTSDNLNAVCVAGSADSRDTLAGAVKFLSCPSAELVSSGSAPKDLDGASEVTATAVPSFFTLCSCPIAVCWVPEDSRTALGDSASSSDISLGVSDLPCHVARLKMLKRLCGAHGKTMRTTRISQSA
jgi:hypothetical protein